jgi:hypothetical protein
MLRVEVLIFRSYFGILLLTLDSVVKFGSETLRTTDNTLLSCDNLRGKTS